MAVSTVWSLLTIAVAVVPPTGLKKKLKDLMGDFAELRARIHAENRQVVQRRVYTVTGQQVPEEDIDRMIETGGAGWQWSLLAFAVK